MRPFAFVAITVGCALVAAAVFLAMA